MLTVWRVLQSEFNKKGGTEKGHCMATETAKSALLADDGADASSAMHNPMADQYAPAPGSDGRATALLASSSFEASDGALVSPLASALLLKFLKVLNMTAFV